MGLFKKAREVAESIDEEIVAAVKPEAEPEKPAEEWVWVDGFKGTDKDMQCRGYQFEMDKQFDISDDREVEACEHGFHLCLTVDHVHGYYPIGDDHRYFAVKALVRKSDLNEYGTYKRQGWIAGIIDKLAAKSIIFTRELTLDEIFEYHELDWSDEDKKTALTLGIAHVRRLYDTQTLVDVGYSETFAKIIVDQGKYDIAKALGDQKDLSMDMKVWVLFGNKKEN